MGGTSCELLGRWHRWRTIEFVMDRSADPGAQPTLNHAVRVMRCERCGATSWRWSVAPAPTGSGPAGGGVRTVVHVRGGVARPGPD